MDEITKAAQLASHLYELELNVRARNEKGLTQKEKAVITIVIIGVLTILGLTMKELGLRNGWIGATLIFLAGVGAIGYLPISWSVKKRVIYCFDNLCERTAEEFGVTPGFAKRLAYELHCIAAADSIKALKELDAEFKRAAENPPRPQMCLPDWQTLKLIQSIQKRNSK